MLLRFIFSSWIVLTFSAFFDDDKSKNYFVNITAEFSASNGDKIEVHIQQKRPGPVDKIPVMVNLFFPNTPEIQIFFISEMEWVEDDAGPNFYDLPGHYAGLKGFDLRIYDEAIDGLHYKAELDHIRNNKVQHTIEGTWKVYRSDIE